MAHIRMDEPDLLSRLLKEIFSAEDKHFVREIDAWTGDPTVQKRLVKAQDQVNRDRHFITEILKALTTPCKTMQETRDALPECLAALDPELAGYPRTREEAWTLKPHHSEFHQYPDALIKIQTYLAMRLLY